MSRGPIPDRPAVRPTVPHVAKLASAYYAKPGNGAGGSLHIVLDDANLEDSNIRFCLEYARERGDRDGVELAQLIIELSPTQRRRLVYGAMIDR